MIPVAWFVQQFRSIIIAVISRISQLSLIARGQKIPYHQLVVLFFGNLRQEDSLKRLFGKAKTRCLAGLMLIGAIASFLYRSLNLFLGVSLNPFWAPVMAKHRNFQVPRSLELAWPFSAAWQSWIRFLKLGDVLASGYFNMGKTS